MKILLLFIITLFFFAIPVIILHLLTIKEVSNQEAAVVQIVKIVGVKNK